MKGGVRITSGALRGRRLSVPSTARPTQDRVREALFSIWGMKVGGSRFLDLFAGTGAVGIEALSRGAEQAWFVESSADAVGVLRRNLTKVGFDPEGGSKRRALVRRRDVKAFIEAFEGKKREPFDLIFADPPYAWGDYPALVDLLAPVLAPAGEIAIEHRRGESMTLSEDSPLELTEDRRYGESALARYRLR